MQLIVISIQATSTILNAWMMLAILFYQSLSTHVHTYDTLVPTLAGARTYHCWHKYLATFVDAHAYHVPTFFEARTYLNQ